MTQNELKDKKRQEKTQMTNKNSNTINPKRLKQAIKNNNTK